MGVLKRSFDDGVLTLTLNRPGSLNALDDELQAELSAALDLDENVRCVVLAGAGDAFCAGGDISAMGEEGTPVERRARIDRTQDLAARLYNAPVPTVAKVDGIAVGAGLGIAMACDIALASPNARFGTAFRNVGLGPDTGVSFLLTRLVGRRVALELCYTGDIVNAERAASLGLVNRIVERDLDSAVHELASDLASGPTVALGMTKRLVLANLDRDFEAALEAEASTQSLLSTTAEHSEGVEAFREGRQPKFEGR